MNALLSQEPEIVTTLNRITELFQTCNTLVEIYAGLPVLLTERFGSPAAGIGLLEDEGHELVIVGHKGLPPTTPANLRIKTDGVFTNQIGSDNKSFAFQNNNESNTDNFQIWNRMGFKSMVGAPIYSHEKTHGLLFIASYDNSDTLTQYRSILWFIANHLALEIEARQAHDNVRFAQATVDRANEAKNIFLANMSHELRTPLNAIIGFSEMLKDGVMGNLDQNQKKALTSIFDSGIQLVSLINDILDLSKIEAGQLGLDLSYVDLPKMLESCLVIIKERAVRHNITLELEIDPEIYWVRLDEIKFKQIMFNLLSNAVKFTPDGGDIDIKTRKVATVPSFLRKGESVEVLEISVSDNGIGIAREDQARLFKPFEQLDCSMSKRHAGSGLGLALTKRLVELHGGTITLESEENLGTCFTVRLPYRASLDHPGGVFK